MVKRFLAITKFVFVAYFLSANVFAEENNIANTLSTKQAIQNALTNNPNLAQINARFLALSEIPTQLKALPEPKIKFNVANLPLDSFSIDQSPMTQIQFGISQSLPYPGKLALKSQAAKNLATATSESWLDAKRKLIQQIRHQWWQLFYLDHALKIVDQNFTVLEQFIEVAETKYSVGQGLQQDILLAQVESYRLQDKKLQLKSVRRNTEINLNRLMGENNQTKIRIDRLVDAKLPTLKNTEAFLLKARTQRPDMKRAKSLANVAENRYELAKKDYYPDFQMAAIYGWRKEQADLASLQFSMNLPWDTGNRQNPAKDQRNYEWMQQKYAIKDIENGITEEIDSAITNYQRATQQVKLYSQSIIPQAEQMVEAMLAGYQVNKVDFLNLLRAQITLFNYETQYWQSLSMAKQALAALDAAIGQEYSHE